MDKNDEENLLSSLAGNLGGRGYESEMEAGDCIGHYLKGNDACDICDVQEDCIEVTEAGGLEAMEEKRRKMFEQKLNLYGKEKKK